ncbi:hypothetical protein SNEBB_009289 [Seison nebaliae]|nr:hypothetical protein SNEBB_009289 [Seison nebaliae]
MSHTSRSNNVSSRGNGRYASSACHSSTYDERLALVREKKIELEKQRLERARLAIKVPSGSPQEHQRTMRTKSKMTSSTYGNFSL